MYMYQAAYTGTISPQREQNRYGHRYAKSLTFLMRHSHLLTIANLMHY